MNEPVSLQKLLIGQSGRICGFNSDEVPMKLYELGIIPGSFVTLKKRLPFGGPVCIQIHENQNLIALRNSEAKSILIERFL
jgi:ferrous iron transport protein A